MTATPPDRRLQRQGFGAAPAVPSPRLRGEGKGEGRLRLTRMGVISGRSALVLGGARSGKSRYALNLAEAAAPTRLMIATAQALDAEMAARIARHQAERGAGWTTREEPLELIEALRQETRPGRAALVDCVTLWLTNVMLAGCDMAAAIEELAALVPTLAGPVIFVSNEVGCGITPTSKLGREFQDGQGRANQALARACEMVVAVQAGLPRLLKPAAALELQLR